MIEKIHYSSADGTMLCGILNRVSGSASVALLCHGITGNKDEQGCFPALSSELEKRKISSFRFDFRAHGESGGSDLDMTLSGEKSDVLSTVAMLESMGFTKIAVLGASFGGGIVSQIDYHNYKSVKTLVIWYGVMDYQNTCEGIFSKERYCEAQRQGFFAIGGSGKIPPFRLSRTLFDEMYSVSPAQILAKSSLPVLILHGDADTTIPLETSVDAAKICKNAHLCVIKGGEHTFFNSEKAFKEAIEKTAEYISRYI